MLTFREHLLLLALNKYCDQHNFVFINALPKKFLYENLQADLRNLIKFGYIEKFNGADTTISSITLTDEGKRYTQLKWTAFVNFTFKSILIPFFVALITALIKDCILK